jgi:hypothetical protein
LFLFDITYWFYFSHWNMHQIMHWLHLWLPSPTEGRRGGLEMGWAILWTVQGMSSICLKLLLFMWNIQLGSLNVF